ncbi:MAG: PilZ domain-containing protein [Phycisphaerae bacterium]|nr:PilZ domain-containing protein [Phycisphaerae bacterium]
MAEDKEKRKHRRQPARMGVFCHKIGSLDDYAFNGSTVDISPGGLLIEGNLKAAIEAGDLCNIELDMPDAYTAGQIGGKVSAYARVVRIVELHPEHTSSKKHIGLQFCSRPEFDI